MSLEIEKKLQLKVLSKGPLLAAVQLTSGVQATLHVKQEWLKQLVPNCELVVVNYQLCRNQEDIHIHVDTDGKGLCFLQADERRGPCVTAEVFAGIAGWSHAAKHLGCETMIHVEHDPVTAKACAKSMGIPCVNAREAIQMALGDRFEPVVLCGDVTNPLTWVYLGLCNTAFILMSPPCQPWSSSGRNKGTSCDDGRAFSITI